MSRSGYSDGCDFEPLEIGRWRAQVLSATRGKRGQAFLIELAKEMDAMPEKRLISGDLIDSDGECCAIGVICKSRNIDISEIESTLHDQVGDAVNIASQLAAEIAYHNDEGGEARTTEEPEARWTRMRAWVQSQIKEVQK